MNEQRVIWKFTLPLSTNEIELPRGSTILSVHNQHDTVCLWVLVNPESITTEKRIFEVFTTGSPIAYTMGTRRNFIGTVLLEHGIFVVHVFERIT